MNYTHTIAQPCFCRQYRGQAPQIKPNTRERFVLLEELAAEREPKTADGDTHWYYEECLPYIQLKTPMGGIFTQVYKAVYNVESWKDYGYFLVGEVGLEEVYKLIKSRLVWPFPDLMAFGDREPTAEDGLVTYNDTHVIVGVNKPHKCKILKRRD